MNIRTELEALRDDWEERRHIVATHGNSDRAAIYEGRIMNINSLLQRIPEGCELRPREPSDGMVDAYYREHLRLTPNREITPRARMASVWRAMWDTAKAEDDDE